MSAPSSRVAVFGAGYVGLVTGACFAELGHSVVGRDVIEERVAALRRGEVPIYEPGLEDLIARNAPRLSFTSDVAEAIEGADFVYIAVGTPPTYSGDADLAAVWTVIDELPAIERRCVVVMKSTVPVGTGLKVRHRLDERGLHHVGYVSNPEFTAEGAAVRDFLQPDRIVIGAFDDGDGDAVAGLHAGIEAPVVRCDVASAEMIKLAANAALMTRISFINEIANVCEATGADVVRVAEGIGLDRRIGPSFLRAGIGYGGSCLDGSETVLVRTGLRSWLTTLQQLHTDLDEGQGRDLLSVHGLEVLSWIPGDDAPSFRPLSHVTRRPYDGEVVDLVTQMGRRLTCTVDHPLLVGDGRGRQATVKLAGDLTEDDWLPVAQGAEEPAVAVVLGDVIEGMVVEGLHTREVIVRPSRAAWHHVERRRLVRAVGRRGSQRAAEVIQTGSLRLSEALSVDLDLRGAAVRTALNGTEVPIHLEPDAAFWRIAGLYAAVGHCTAAGRRRHLRWSFHPTDEEHLVDEVAAYWRRAGVEVAIRRNETATAVVLSSRLLAGWWLGVLGLGATRYDQGVPDSLWAASAEHKLAFVSGAWQGNGCLSRVEGRHAGLEYGTVSKRLAEGMLRLLGDLGIVARLQIGRTPKSTVARYRLVVSGSEQVARMLEPVQTDCRMADAESLVPVRRVAPTGYRREQGSAWVRVVGAEKRQQSGFVYSLEVPEAHTFVTTGGLVVHNCFPKDSLALKQLAANSGYHFQLLNAVIEVNELQKRRVIGKLHTHLGSLRNRRVALLGLAFKPHTDDMREAPSLVLAGRLLAEGADVVAWDPVVDGHDLHGVEIADTPEAAARDADAVVVVTEWPQLADVDWAAVGSTMRTRVLIDGRNMLDPVQLREAGFTVEGVGRATRPGGV